MQTTDNSQSQSVRLRLTFISSTLIALILIGLWLGNVFMNIRQRVMDIYFAPAPTSDSIVIIAIDDRSLDRYGSSLPEWSRTVYADLINVLATANPRVVAFDVLFSEAKPEDEAFAEALAQLRNNEARTRVVIANAGINNITITDPATSAIYAFAEDLPLSPLITAESDYRGYANTVPDRDGVVRRQPSLIMVNDDTEYAFSIAVYLANLRIPASAAEQVIIAQEQQLQVTPNRTVQVDSHGFWQPYFFGAPAAPNNGAFPTFSLVDVIDGNVDPETFQDKIVMIGLANATGLFDQYLVPSSTTGNLMAGVEIQAHAVESLIQSSFVKPLPVIWQIALIVGLVFLSSLLFAFLRWYLKLTLLIALAIVWIVIASVIFSTTLMAISLFDTLLALALPAIVSLGIDITVERWQRTRQQFLLDSLQHIAQQRLRLEQAASYILTDIQSVAPETTSKLYLQDDTQPHGWLMYTQNHTTPQQVTDSATISYYQKLAEPQTQANETIFPFVWQGQTKGVLRIEHPRKRQLSDDADNLIRDFVQQLSPHIDNMLLYNAAEHQKRLLDSVFTESPLSIAVMTAAGKIVRHNEHLASLLYENNADLCAQYLPELFGKKAEEEGIQQHLEENLRHGQAFSINEIRIGTAVVRLDAAPLRTYDLWTVTINDITSLVELSQLKTQMLRLAAHDLKNPLTRIMGFAELLLLQRPDLQENQDTYLGIISQAAKDMSNIIEDILNLERLRSGQVKLVVTNITPMFHEICSSHQPDIIQKQQTFNLNIPTEKIHVRADVGRLSQAVSNLIGNAIKYTPDEGRIDVIVEQRDDMVYFEVKDTGYGIPAAAQEKLFSEFFRAKTVATAHIPGTGLGLSLTKTIIEEHHGKIGFTSEEGVGSTFYFTLPVAEMETQTNE